MSQSWVYFRTQTWSGDGELIVLLARLYRGGSARLDRLFSPEEMELSWAVYQWLWKELDAAELAVIEGLVIEMLRQMAASEGGWDPSVAHHPYYYQVKNLRDIVHAERLAAGGEA